MKESFKEKIEEEKTEEIIEKKEVSETEETLEESVKKQGKNELEEKKNNKKFNKVKGKKNKIEKEMKLPKENNKNKKIIALIISVVVVVLISIISTIFAILNIGSENIISGVSIEGIEVSGLSKTEAIEKLNSLYAVKKEKEIGLKYEDYVTTLTPSVMEVNYDVEKAVDEAYLIGKDSNIFINNYNILFTLIGKKNIEVNMTFNEDIAKQTLEDIGVNLPGIMIDSSYSIEGDKLIITKGQEGICIDSEGLLNKVKDNLNDINIIEDDIEIPVISKKPEEIDIQKIHEEIYKEAKDAYYTKDPFTVYPEVEGIDFDVEAAKAILQEEKDEYEIPLVITKPKITLNDIGSEAFPDKLATFTTRYDVSSRDRTTNLVIACQKINGKVVLAGETFSYNKALGARTAAAGYKNAKVYENGEVVDGIGGGICQISSTLYNSVLMANLEIVERRNHQFVTSYLPAGRDATVVYGMTDFRFKNTRQYPIRIAASAQNGIATVSIYGIKEEKEYTFSFSTKTVASIPFTTKYVDDNTLPAGTEKVKQKGANGLKTETYITKMLDGKVVSTRLLSRDTYDAMARIVLRNTKSNETIPTQTQTQTNNNNSSNKQNTIQQQNKENVINNNTSKKNETTNSVNTNNTNSNKKE